VLEGHVVGNHSYHHRKRDALLDFGYDEAAITQRAIEQAAGVTPRFYRPPNGFHTPWSLRAVRGEGMRTVVWDVDPYDWKNPSPETIVRRVLNDVRPGSIVLLHDGMDTQQGADRSATVAALPGIIEGLRARGYRLVTVAELLGEPPYQGWGDEAINDER
jgi:peptidoglycan/xylan/chitin deacetylase (PgdA/CDA1 family)